MNFIDNGNYFENFPTVESYILTIDYTELTAALATLNGVPCTPEGSFLRALSKWQIGLSIGFKKIKNTM